MSGLIGLLLAILFLIYSYFITKGIPVWIHQKGIPFEYGLFPSAIFIVIPSYLIYWWNPPYGALIAFSFAGMVVSIIQVLFIPILIFLRKHKQASYEQYIQRYIKHF